MRASLNDAGLFVSPELKSSLDQSELVVRQLTGEHLVVDNATEIGFRGLEPAVEGNRESGEQAVQQNIAVLCMCALARGAFAESQPRALKWAESSGGVGIVSTFVPLGTLNRPF